MHLDRKKGKIIAGIAGIAAVAVLTVLLILGTIGAPGSDVLASVNGEKITAEDVAAVQASYLQSGMNITTQQALEQLITEELLYQEAEGEGYSLTPEEAEQELVTRLASMGKTIEDLKAQLEAGGLSYDEYLQDLPRQLAIDNYVNAEIEISEPTLQEVMEFYEAFKESSLQQNPDALIPSFEQLQSEIVKLLSQEKQQEAMLLHIEKLKAEADIRIYE